MGGQGGQGRQPSTFPSAKVAPSPLLQRAVRMFSDAASLLRRVGAPVSCLQSWVRGPQIPRHSALLSSDRTHIIPHHPQMINSEADHHVLSASTFKRTHAPGDARQMTLSSSNFHSCTSDNLIDKSPMTYLYWFVVSCRPWVNFKCFYSWLIRFNL